jgi:hypothetical protein
VDLKQFNDTDFLTIKGNLFQTDVVEGKKEFLNFDVLHLKPLVQKPGNCCYLVFAEHRSNGF